MKQFLLEKMNTLSKEILVEFNLSITSALPVAIEDSPLHQNIWGIEEEGFWYINKTFGYFFEKNGVFHTLDTERNKIFHDLILGLYEANEIEKVTRISKPLEFEELVLESDTNPFGIKKGQTLYYNKFVTPTGCYGNPFSLDRLIGKHPFSPEILSISMEGFNQWGWIVKKIKELGFNSDFMSTEGNNILRDEAGFFFFVPNSSSAVDNDNDFDGLLKKGDSSRFDSSMLEYIKKIWTTHTN
jgi:hypothetical protein